MSVTPKNHTKILIKDLAFQTLHQLSHTQVDIMAYLINTLSWALEVDAYRIITNKKILDDLPHMNLKTLEHTLKVLRDKGLILSEIISVPQWNGSRVRGIKITPAGLTYNNHYYKAKEQSIIEDLEKKLMQKEEELESLKLIYEASQETPKKESSPTAKPETPSTSEQTSSYDDITDFKAFVHFITKEFQTLGTPLCNGVEGWLDEVVFSINSYGKLHVSTLEKSYQLNEPEKVYAFWQWLFQNKHKIGVIKDCTAIERRLTQLYQDIPIVIHDIKAVITHIEEKDGGVILHCYDILKEKTFQISSKGSSILSPMQCEKIIENIRCDR